MSDAKTITLLQINDTHGYLEPHPELFWVGNRAVHRMAGGYALILSGKDKGSGGTAFT